MITTPFAWLINTDLAIAFQLSGWSSFAIGLFIHIEGEKNEVRKLRF